MMDYDMLISTVETNRSSAPWSTLVEGDEQ